MLVIVLENGTWYLLCHLVLSYNLHGPSQRLQLTAAGARDSQAVACCPQRPHPGQGLLGLQSVDVAAAVFIGIPSVD